MKKKKPPPPPKKKNKGFQKKATKRKKNLKGQRSLNSPPNDFLQSEAESMIIQIKELQMT